jgi:hypothetical protein
VVAVERRQRHDDEEEQHGELRDYHDRVRARRLSDARDQHARDGEDEEGGRASAEKMQVTPASTNEITSAGPDNAIA